MGWDITYHPVGADEIHSIYFKGLTDPDHYKSLVTRFGVDDFYAEQLRISSKKLEIFKAMFLFKKDTLSM